MSSEGIRMTYEQCGSPALVLTVSCCVLKLATSASPTTQAYTIVNLPKLPFVKLPGQL